MKEHESWNQKLKAFLNGLEVENVDKLMKEGSVADYTHLGMQMASIVKQRTSIATQALDQVKELLVIVKGLEKDIAIEMGDNVDDQD